MKGKTLKKVMGLLMTFTLLISSIPAAAAEEEEPETAPYAEAYTDDENAEKAEEESPENEEESPENAEESLENAEESPENAGEGTDESASEDTEEGSETVSYAEAYTDDENAEKAEEESPENAEESPENAGEGTDESASEDTEEGSETVSYAEAYTDDENAEKAEEESPENAEEGTDESEPGDEDTVIYAYMNVPYDIFYSGLNNTGTVDTVTSATTGQASRFRNVYLTEGETVSLYGVVIPVALTVSAYNELSEKGFESTDAYYVGDIVENPAVYMEVTYENEVLGFSGIKSSVTTTMTVAAELTSDTTWGDYMLALWDSNYGFSPEELYGAYLTMTDGSQYALKQSENMWTPGNYYEFAWSTGVKLSEPHGNTFQYDYYADMEGKTIQSLTYITVDGIVVYNLSGNMYVTPHMGVELSAGFTGPTSAKINGIPEDAKNVTAKVKAAGRNGETIAEEAVVDANGCIEWGSTGIELTTSVYDEETDSYSPVYDITVYSDNYAAYTIEDLTYPCIHNVVIDAAVDPTCTEEGLTEGSHCSLCGEVMEEQEIIPAKGHVPAEAVTENLIKATDTAEGSYESVIYCMVCGKELSRETVIIPATETEPEPPQGTESETDLQNESESETDLQNESEQDSDEETDTAQESGKNGSDDSVQTGDSSPIAVYAAVMLLALMLLAAGFFTLKRRQSKN